MRIKIFITIITLAILSLFGFQTYADLGDYNAGSYTFHLYLDDKGQLVVDRDFQFSYDVSTDPFVAPPISTQFPYRGEVINMTGEIAETFQFDPRNIGALQGGISVNAPYVADGQKVVFYDNQNQPILTIPVSDSSFCNDDGICNADRGEDSLSCPKDCKQSLPAPPVTTPTSTPTSSSGLVSAILYTLAGLILAGLGWWYFKRRGKSDNMTLPPASPPTSLPTPSAPLPILPPTPSELQNRGSSISQPSASSGEKSGQLSNNPV